MGFIFCCLPVLFKAVKFGKFSSKNAANSEILKNAGIIR